MKKLIPAFCAFFALVLTAPLVANAQQAAQPEVVVKATHGDWEVKCIGQTDECQIYQLMKDQNGNALAEISIFKLPGSSQAVAGANLVTPLETLLTEQVTVEFDEQNAKKYPFSFCTKIGCIARVGLTADEIGIFKAGTASKVTVIPAANPSKDIVLTLSLKGFTKAYSAL